MFDYSHPPVRLGVRRWPHPPPPLLTSLAWNDPQTVAWSHLRKRRERILGCIVNPISFLSHGSVYYHPAFYITSGLHIYKQLGFNLLVFSLSSGASPRHNVGGWVLPVHSQQTLLQGVVTYMLPVEAFATAIKFFWLAKSVLDRLLRLLITWFSRVKGHIATVHSWLLIFSSLKVILIPWSAPPKRALIAWFNFDPSCTGH